MRITTTKRIIGGKTRKHPKTLRLIEKNGRLALDVNNDGRIGVRDPVLICQTEGTPWSENEVRPVTRQELESWDKNADGVLDSSEFPDTFKLGSNMLNKYSKEHGLALSLKLDQGSLSGEWTPKGVSLAEATGLSAFFTSAIAGCGLAMDSLTGGNGLVGTLVGGSIGLVFAGVVLSKVVNPPTPPLVPGPASSRAALI